MNLKQHRAISILGMTILSGIVTGCSIGSEVKGYDDLKNCSFPDLNEAPDIKTEQQKKMHAIADNYTQKRKNLESKHKKIQQDFLKND